MSKRKVDIARKVMEKIDGEEIKMKPRWLFILGWVTLALGVFGSYLLATFLVSLISFSLKTHGPMGALRWQQLISSFPLWAVPLVVVGIGSGVWMLRKYDFSYRHNFVYIILAFVLAVVLSGWFIDYAGIDEVWSKGGMMKKMYQKYDGSRGRVLPWKGEKSDYSWGKNGQRGKMILY